MSDLDFIASQELTKRIIDASHKSPASITEIPTRSFQESRELLGERLIGLVANLARRAYAIGERKVIIADEKGFVPVFREELANRLGLANNEIYGNLYLEFDKYLRSGGRKNYGWGEFVIDGGIVLKVSDSAGDAPEINERNWRVVK